MRCNVCGEKLLVTETKNYYDVCATRRRKRCSNGHLVTTIEIPVDNKNLRTKTLERVLTEALNGNS